eukprot:3102252-Prymnesium_polylepis.1
MYKVSRSSPGAALWGRPLRSVHEAGRRGHPRGSSVDGVDHGRSCSSATGAHAVRGAAYSARPAGSTRPLPARLPFSGRSLTRAPSCCTASRSRSVAAAAR